MKENDEIIHNALRELGLLGKISLDHIKALYNTIIKDFKYLNNREPNREERYALALLAIDEILLRLGYLII